jgi:SET domain-containing protein
MQIRYLDWNCALNLYDRCREGRKKQNLKCVRYAVDGECRVLLVANRDISKGERLYYDYNGSEHEYPTHHFV